MVELWLGWGFDNKYAKDGFQTERLYETKPDKQEYSFSAVVFN